jgi:hypothetical protein
VCVCVCVVQCPHSLTIIFSNPSSFCYIGTEVSLEASERSKEKASLDQLQKAYTELNSRKIKDPLSSFLPDIPGEEEFLATLCACSVGFLVIVSNR